MPLHRLRLVTTTGISAKPMGALNGYVYVPPGEYRLSRDGGWLTIVGAPSACRISESWARHEFVLHHTPGTLVELDD